MGTPAGLGLSHVHSVFISHHVILTLALNLILLLEKNTAVFLGLGCMLSPPDSGFTIFFLVAISCSVFLPFAFALSVTGTHAHRQRSSHNSRVRVQGRPLDSVCTEC